MAASVWMREAAGLAGRSICGHCCPGRPSSTLRWSPLLGLPPPAALLPPFNSIPTSCTSHWQAFLSCFMAPNIFPPPGSPAHCCLLTSCPWLSSPPFPSYPQTLHAYGTCVSACCISSIARMGCAVSPLLSHSGFQEAVVQSFGLMSPCKAIQPLCLANREQIVKNRNQKPILFMFPHQKGLFSPSEISMGNVFSIARSARDARKVFTLLQAISLQ